MLNKFVFSLLLASLATILRLDFFFHVFSLYLFFYFIFNFFVWNNYMNIVVGFFFIQDQFLVDLFIGFLIFSNHNFFFHMNFFN
jgi:hypothetical protein